MRGHTLDSTQEMIAQVMSLTVISLLHPGDDCTSHVADSDLIAPPRRWLHKSCRWQWSYCSTQEMIAQVMSLTVILLLHPGGDCTSDVADSDLIAPPRRRLHKWCRWQWSHCSTQEETAQVMSLTVILLLHPGGDCTSPVSDSDLIAPPRRRLHKWCRWQWSYCSTQEETAQVMSLTVILLLHPGGDCTSPVSDSDLIAPPRRRLHKWCRWQWSYCSTQEETAQVLSLTVISLLHPGGGCTSDVADSDLIAPPRRRLHKSCRWQWSYCSTQEEAAQVMSLTVILLLHPGGDCTSHVTDSDLIAPPRRRLHKSCRWQWSYCSTQEEAAQVMSLTVILLLHPGGDCTSDVADSDLIAPPRRRLHKSCRWQWSYCSTPQQMEYM